MVNSAHREEIALRATLAILVMLSITTAIDPTIAQPRPDGLFEIDPANLANLPPGVTPLRRWFARRFGGGLPV